MGLFDKKPKVKTNTVLFVQKRVEMSALYSTYIEYLNDTEEHNKGDFEIYHYETTDRKGNPYITVRYNAKEKTGMILFNDQFEVETKEMTVLKGEYALQLTEPDITIHKFGAKRINAKGMIRYISVLNSINKTKIKPSLFYDVNNLEEFEKPLEFTFVTLNPNQKAGDVFAEGITSTGDKFTYFVTEVGVKAINKTAEAEKKAEAEAEAKAKAAAEAEAKAKVEAELRIKAEAEAKAKAAAEADARAKAEAEAAIAAAELAKAQADARAKAEAEAGTSAAREKARAAEEARLAAEKAAAEAKAKAAAEKAAAEAEKKAAEAEKRAAEEARLQAQKAAEEARLAAEKAAEEARTEARRRAEEAAAKAKAEAEAAAEAAREEARKHSEAARAEAKAAEEARLKAEEEAAAAKAAVEAARAKAESAAEEARKNLAKEQMKQMLKDGMPPKLVAKYTGFPEEEVQKVADVLKLLGDL